MYEYCTETDADRAVAEIMVVASACIIHKLIRGSLPRLAFAMLDGPVLLAICAIRMLRESNDGNGTWVTGSWGACGPTTPRSQDAIAPKARIPRALNQERKHETLNAAASARVKM